MDTLRSALYHCEKSQEVHEHGTYHGQDGAYLAGFCHEKDCDG